MDTSSNPSHFLQHRFPQLFGGLLSLSLALVVGAWWGSSAIRTLRSNDALTVTGSAKRPIRSDYIIWRSSVSSQQPTLAKAYQEIKGYTDRVQTYFKSKNIPDTAITLKAIDTQSIPEVTVNGNQTGKTLAYHLTQSFEIRSNAVDQIATLARSSTELIDEGIPFTSESPQYLYTQLSQLRVEMIGEATKDAKARAEAIVHNTGGHLGVIRGAETGVFQITSRYSTDVSDSGIYDTSSLEKDITAVVSITFGMEP